ncbi:phosphonate C-P lyase system protein PhnG [uncultured Brevibacillus sp.]|uniref:phosphonate C-P lyase system protein PhnG n=1 Tax=uncultured Brevibacillus sp. TaxID=169970 RepID=UPI002599DCD5|nr:phosphonate C-P lyase system protein PhnG [uncultured Brevibacillus sp.]
MKRKRRTEILINGSKELAAQLADEIIHHYDVETIEEPNNGLVMVKVRETAKKSMFYMGEVFVTECKVQINGSIGLGIVKSHDHELAYQLAVIDAAYNVGLQETSEWTSRLLGEEERIVEQRKTAQSKVLKTKVSFETMDDE